MASEPVWSREAPLLYYVEHRGSTPRLMAARIAAGNPPIVTSRTVIVEEFAHEGVTNHANWDVAPDGRILLVEPLAGGRWLMVTDWKPSS